MTWFGHIFVSGRSNRSHYIYIYLDPGFVLLFKVIVVVVVLLVVEGVTRPSSFTTRSDYPWLVHHCVVLWSPVLFSFLKVTLGHF